jgi:hypothetical protein
LSLVNVLPDGTSQPNAVFGFGPPGSSKGKQLSRVISADGSRIFWADVSTGDLYARENPTQPPSPLGEHGECTVFGDACTVQVDAAAQGAPGTGGGGQFWSASSDGSKIFFTDEKQLTEGSTAAAGEPDLYEYQFDSEPGATGKLIDLTVDAHSGEHAGVQGVVGVGEEGSYVYFAAKGVLAENENAEGEKAQAQTCGQAELCNLYVIHEGESPRFIATLSGADGSQEPPYSESEDFKAIGGPGDNYGDWTASESAHTAEASPAGSTLVFMSRRSLTGYANDELSEVYVYEFDGSKLLCASCNPNGESPTGNEDGSAGFLPVASTRQEAVMQWISEGGSQVFFDSAVPLVSRDVNDTQDVYEWERDGSGGCKEADGCVSLLSSGTSPDGSWLIGSSVSGDDVFFTTRAQLVAEDQNENYDLYDAHVGGGQPLAEQACAGTGCQGVPSAPPAFATPASVTFSGAGNIIPPAPETAPRPKPKAKTLTRAQKLASALRTCRHESKHKRGVCEAKAKKRYHAHAAAHGATRGRRQHA